MGQFSLNGTFTYLPDPTVWIPEGFRELGVPARRTWFEDYESGIVGWDCLTQQEYGELHTRWAANNSALTSGTLPEQNASGFGTYDTVTSAWWHEPLGEARGNRRFNVRMRVSFITRA